ncbi:hypothetical protein HGA34_02130 [Candidatus Falkowbacteria bacterium]|nr:hypothetical protein [Candidatus Falkowbacteria bacterium]
MKEQIEQDFGVAEMTWRVPEYEKHERDRRWYILAGVVVVLLVVYAFWTDNFLFMGIILLGSFILVLNETQEAPQVEISLTDEGVVVGRKFYDYDQLNNFGIVYKPNIGAKNLYFEFKSPMKQRLSIPLMEQDPLAVRKELLKYLPEDLDRTNRPLSENLSRLLKL